MKHFFSTRMSDGWGECGRMEAVTHVEVSISLCNLTRYVYKIFVLVKEGRY